VFRRQGLNESPQVILGKDQRFLEEGRQSPSHDRAVFSLLQLLPRAFHVESDTGNGSWNLRSHLDLDEMCGLLPEAPSVAKRIDKGLILKALGGQ